MGPFLKEIYTVENLNRILRFPFIQEGFYKSMALLIFFYKLKQN